MTLTTNTQSSMKSRTTIKNVKRLSVGEYAQCLNLTLGEDGTMQSELAYQYELERTETKVILLKKNNRIIAWCLLVNCGSSFLTHFFVDEDYRRQGIASYLMRQALGEGAIQCCALDDTSAAFFKNFESLIECEFEDSGRFDFLVEDEVAA